MQSGCECQSRRKTYVVEDDQGLSPAAVDVADRIEDTTAHNSRQKLLNEENQQDSANSGQVEVVDQKEGLQLEGFAVAHELPPAEYDSVVDDDEDAGLLKRRHGGFARNKSEVLGRVADDSLEGLAEDGP